MCLFMRMFCCACICLFMLVYVFMFMCLPICMSVFVVVLQDAAYSHAHGNFQLIVLYYMEIESTTNFRIKQIFANICQVLESGKFIGDIALKPLRFLFSSITVLKLYFAFCPFIPLMQVSKAVYASSHTICSISR